MWPQTSLTELLGIVYPIVQAPMAGFSTPALAAAVSNAGGLGSLGCAMLEPEQLRAGLRELRAATNRPVNANFFAHAPPSEDAAPRAHAGAAPALLRRVRHRVARSAPGAAAAVRRCSPGGGAERAAGRRELSLRPAGGGASRGLAGGGHPRAELGDHRRRSALARGARRCCGDRAGL